MPHAQTSIPATPPVTAVIIVPMIGTGTLPATTAMTSRIDTTHSGRTTKSTRADCLGTPMIQPRSEFAATAIPAAKRASEMAPAIRS